MACSFGMKVKKPSLKREILWTYRVQVNTTVMTFRSHSGRLKLEIELSVNPSFGSVAPEGHHLEPHHGRARDRPLQDQQEVNFDEICG